MSLKTDYFDGLTGLHANLNNAFASGVALIGTGVTEISSLDLGDRNGSNVGAAPAGGTQASFTGSVAGMTSSVTIQANVVGTAGNVTLSGDGTLTINQIIVAWNSGHASNQAVVLTAGDGTQVPNTGTSIALTGGTANVPQPGIYLDLDGPGSGYRLWMSVSAGQIAPASAGRQLVQVIVDPSASRAQLASSINDAILAISGSPFETEMIGDSLRIETSQPKTVANSIALSSGWGIAVVAVVQVGSDSTGNFSTIRAALLDNAAQGSTTFVVSLVAGINPTALRANKGNNLLLKAYLAGIQKGLSDQQLYEYEVTPTLNVSDTITTSIDLNFAFQVV
jgi:hypothetical protein